MVVLFIWEVLKIPRIIVKTGYIKGKAHKEYYVQYIATREGVEKYKSDHGDKPATTKTTDQSVDERLSRSKEDV